MRYRLREFPVHFRSISPASFFVFCAVLFFFIYNILTPPLQAPDELSHLYRIYQLSEGTMIAQQSDTRVGGTIPYSVTDFALPVRLVNTSEHKLNSRDYDQLLKQPLNPEVRTFRDFPNTAQYNLVSYIPQVTAFFILRNFNAPVIALYYAARFFAFFCWVLMVFFCIKLLPFFRWQMVLLALLPMTLYLSNSLSADTMTNGLAFLLVAYVLHLSCVMPRITTRQLVLLCSLCILLSLAKIVYTPIVLLVFLIPASKYSSARQRFFYSLLIIVISAVFALWWSGVVMKNYLPDYEYNPVFRNDATVGFRADMRMQKQYIIEHPLYFPRVVLNTLFNSSQPYLKSYIGFFGTFQDRTMPGIVYWISWSTILLSTFFSSGQTRFSNKQRLLMLFSVTSAFLLVILSQHLTWDQVGSGIVDLMQGRYIIPLVPVVLLSFSGIAPSYFKPVFLIVSCIFVINGFAVYTLFERFVEIPFTRSEFFYSLLESRNPDGRIKTSHPAYSLSTENNITHDTVRSGNSSVISSPEFPYVLGCALPHISGGDLIEIELWRKGRGASLVLSGGKKECETIYVANDYPDYTDYKGWEHVHMQYKVPGNCDDFVLNFLVHNPGRNVVYIDDISFTIRRGKRK